MIQRDRDLLAKLAKTNRAIAAATVELMQHQDGGELPAEGLRALADNIAPLVDELRQRADQLDAIEAPAEVES